MATPLWINDFRPKIFGLGFVAYIIGSLGMICLMIAYSLGPAGQVAGIINMQCLLLAVIQAVVHK